jgi:hypothetical protein
VASFAIEGIFLAFDFLLFCLFLSSLEPGSFGFTVTSKPQMVSKNLETQKYSLKAKSEVLIGDFE